MIYVALSRVWDVRKLQKKLSVRRQHLVLFHLLCDSPIPQASRDGFLELELEDVEKLDKTNGGVTTLRAEWKHDKSVTSAYWDPRGRSIVSTSYDDTLRCKSVVRSDLAADPRVSHLLIFLHVVWDVSPSNMTKEAPFPHFNPLSRIRHNCQTVRKF